MWNDDASARLRQAFDQTESVFAAETADAVAASLDAYARAWSAGWTDVCEATRASTRTSGLLDRQQACLDASAGRVRSLLDALGSPDEETLANARDAAGALPDPRRCLDASISTALAPMPVDPAERVRIEAARDAMADARTWVDLGDAVAARAALGPAIEQTSSSTYAPLLAEVSLTRGYVARAEDALAEAREAFEQAYFLAYRSGHRAVAAEAALESADSTRRLDALELTASWLEHAEAAHVLLDGDVRSPGLGLQQVALLRARGRPEEALVRVDALLESTWEGPPTRRSVVEARARVLHDLGRMEDALELKRALLDAEVRALGDAHPHVSNRRVSLAGLLYDLRRLGEARSQLDEAIARLESVSFVGPVLANAYNTRSAIEAAEGNFVESERAARRSLEIRTATLGPTHEHTLATRSNLARVLNLRNAHAEAEAELRAVLAARDALGERDPLGRANVLLNLGDAQSDQGASTDALASYDEACRTIRAVRGDHPLLGICLVNRALRTEAFQTTLPHCATSKRPSACSLLRSVQRTVGPAKSGA